MKLIEINEKTVLTNQWFRYAPNFLAECDEPLTDEELKDIQAELGYHPAGYGFCRANTTIKPNEEGKYVYTWSCWDSCE